MMNRVGVWNDAATVWPGSIWRESTTPATGARMIASERLVRFEDSCASAAATSASADLSWAAACACSASADSIPVCEGLFPPDSLDTSLRRDRDALHPPRDARARTVIARPDAPTRDNVGRE